MHVIPTLLCASKLMCAYVGCGRMGLPVSRERAGVSVHTQPVMYDVLTDPVLLSHERAAAPNGLSADRNAWGVPHAWGDLRPVQLAAMLGNREMFEHIANSKRTILWTWGPMVCFSWAMEGIDSSGDDPNDVMEIVTHFDAHPNCRRSTRARHDPTRAPPRFTLAMSR